MLWCCVQIEKLSAWSFSARNSWVQNMQSCTQSAQSAMRKLPCVRAQRKCAHYRVCTQKGNAQLVQNPLSLPSAVLALAADFQSETTARQYDWLGVPWPHIFWRKIMTYLCATPNQTMRKKFKCAGAIKWQISGGYAERQSGYCMMHSVEGCDIVARVNPRVYCAHSLAAHLYCDTACQGAHLVSSLTWMQSFDACTSWCTTAPIDVFINTIKYR